MHKKQITALELLILAILVSSSFSASASKWWFEAYNDDSPVIDPSHGTHANPGDMSVKIFEADSESGLSERVHRYVEAWDENPVTVLNIPG